MLITYLLFLVGFILLVKGANFLVDGASSLARRFGVSALVVGLTIVAFGTSAPELIVNILASLQGSGDIAIGNVVGSNIANILLILGIASMIYPLSVKKGTVWKEIPLSLLAAIILGLMVHDHLIDGRQFSGLTRIDGFILTSYLIIFLYYTFGIAKAEPADSAQTHFRHYGLAYSLFLIAGGLVGLVIGGKWVVDGAVLIARGFGVSEALIGLTIVAVGTSLPELATSAVAAYKKDVDIAAGNIVGSNIFNIFFILGTSAVIHPLPFSPLFTEDLLINMCATILLFLFLFIGKRHVLERWQGAGFVLLYVFYTAYLVTRG